MEKKLAQYAYFKVPAERGQFLVFAGAKRPRGLGAFEPQSVKPIFGICHRNPELITQIASELPQPNVFVTSVGVYPNLIPIGREEAQALVATQSGAEAERFWNKLHQAAELAVGAVG